MSIIMRDQIKRMTAFDRDLKYGETEKANQQLDYQNKYLDEIFKADQCRRDRLVIQKKIVTACAIAMLFIISLAALAPAAAQPDIKSNLRVSNASRLEDTAPDYLISPDMASYLELTHSTIDEYGAE